MGLENPYQNEYSKEESSRVQNIGRKLRNGEVVRWSPSISMDSLSNITDDPTMQAEVGFAVLILLAIFFLGLALGSFWRNGSSISQPPQQKKKDLREKQPVIYIVSENRRGHIPLGHRLIFV
jgi:hypothetical protein